jgi:hypothetical protein
MKRIALLITILALVFPGAALAQGGSTCQAYGQQTCSSIEPVSNSTSSGSTLPFTGLDLALLLAGAALLLGTGIVLRKITDSAK